MRIRQLCTLAICSMSLLLGACHSGSKSADPPAEFMSARLKQVELGTIKRVHAIDGVLLASQPSPEDFAEAKALGVRTVINHRRPSEIEFNERQIVKQLGMRYENPAFGGASELTDAIIDDTRRMLRTAQHPILVHCGSASRVGAVWLAHRVLDDRLSIEDALAESREVGLRSAKLEEVALDYIARHQRSN